jgi:hypothetical protein
MVSDAHALVAQIATLEVVVKSVGQQTSSTLATWFARYTSAADGVSSARNLLRHDLDFPPLS